MSENRKSTYRVVRDQDDWIVVRVDSLTGALSTVSKHRARSQARNAMREAQGLVDKQPQSVAA